MLGSAVLIAAGVSVLLMQGPEPSHTASAESIAEVTPISAAERSHIDRRTNSDSGVVFAASTVEPPRIETASLRSESNLIRNDLIAQTSRVTDQLADALRAAGSISVEPLRTELRQDETAMWHFARLEAHVAVPAVAQDMAEKLARALSDAHVKVERKDFGAQGNARLSVRYQGLECADISVVSGASPNPAMQLAALAVVLAGLDPDDYVRELNPDPEMLPLDSSELNGEEETPLPKAPYTGPLQLAIIVDDGGYGGWITEEILAMPNTLTLSILPHAPYSYETATRAKELGFEIMLHMPMENVSGKTTYPGEVTVTMTAAEMLDLTNQALADVPGAVGINNHTGSKFTSNDAAMRLWLDLIKDRDLFFIDSRTTRHAVAFEVADELEIPTAARDLFLDHESGTNYIRARFHQVIDIVKKQGKAIAICHFRRNTVPVLKEMLPVFDQEGIQIVHASTMVR